VLDIFTIEAKLLIDAKHPSASFQQQSYLFIVLTGI